ncbi:hypothetical protein [Rhodoplanes serenus]|uniref:hypothetical protein n=1 Tax=Rhodoplanes serenus TaxID=200615 RepID=UPI000DAECCAB|nr:hypothetical protein [Rhodoplanes serenus]RAI33181.1 hypothetical protein CH340_13090 [Rhodoplanes serenus]
MKIKVPPSPRAASKARIRRTIETAKAEGLHVTAILPNGTVLVSSSAAPTQIVFQVVFGCPAQKQAEDVSMWDPT